jgi:hypothetical protein
MGETGNQVVTMGSSGLFEYKSLADHMIAEVESSA